MNVNVYAGISLAEMILLILVLAVFLLIVAAQLRSIVATLRAVTWGARAVERQLKATRPNVDKLNWVLEEIAATLPAAIEKAERLGERGVARRGSS